MDKKKRKQPDSHLGPTGQQKANWKKLKAELLRSGEKEIWNPGYFDWKTSSTPRPIAPNILEEIIRSRYLKNLQTHFQSLCSINAPAINLPVGVFQKFHFSAILEAQLRSGSEENKKLPSNLDPVLPFLRDDAKHLHIKHAAFVALHNLLVKAGVATIPAENLCNQLGEEIKRVYPLAVQEMQRLRSSEDKNCQVLTSNSGIQSNEPELSKVHVTATPRHVELTFQDVVLKINYPHYVKLQELYLQANPSGRKLTKKKKKGKRSSQQHQGEFGGSTIRIPFLFKDSHAWSEFHQALFVLLLRYKSIQGPGFQAALGAACFDTLLDGLSCAMECFASPLNCRYRRFCSAFPDTDAAFGSYGSFFDFYPHEGSFEANPPFVPEIIIAMCNHMTKLLAASQAPLSFTIIVGTSPTLQLDPSWHLLLNSPFLTRSFIIPLQQHGYQTGHQHIEKESTTMSSCASAVFFWQNASATAKWPVDEAIEVRLREAFRATLPPRFQKKRTDAYDYGHTAGS
jgi:hypothetical protein